MLGVTDNNDQPGDIVLPGVGVVSIDLLPSDGKSSFLEEPPTPNRA